jgi:Cu+-exporting ATPase
VSGVAVAVGSRRLLAEMAGSAELDARAAARRGEGQTVVLVAIAGRARGLVAVADALKPSTRDAVDELKREGLRLVMLTGDRLETAQAVARALGIAEVHAELAPGDKADVMRTLVASGAVVAMAGDGINDAPALAHAHVGIAMGDGTDVAMQAAGVTLVKGDLWGIARARALGRATVRNIRQNLAFAFLYNTLGIPVAAGVLYPVLGMLLSPMLASAAMSLSSLSVVANALRLRRAPL